METKYWIMFWGTITLSYIIGYTMAFVFMKDVHKTIQLLALFSWVIIGIIFAREGPLRSGNNKLYQRILREEPVKITYLKKVNERCIMVSVETRKGKYTPICLNPYSRQILFSNIVMTNQIENFEPKL